MSTSAVIILLFVVSIFSSLGNKGFTPPAPPAGTIYSEVSSVVPEPSFTGSISGESNQIAISVFISKYRNRSEANTIADSIVRYSQTYNVNPRLVTALILRESRFNPLATSSSNAKGLGQLLPSTAEKLGVTDAYDIDQNVNGTVRYIKSLLDRFHGDVDSAIASYLEGPNAVNRQGGYSYQTKTYVEDILNTCQKI